MKKSLGKHSSIKIAHPLEVAELNRRQMLATGVSMTAYASMGNLLFGGKAYAQSASYTPQKNLIWINMGGGWDILEVTDPKVASTPGIDMIYTWGEAQAVAGATDGTRIGRWLPNIAAIGSDLLVVRGLAMGTTSHEAGNVYMDTGILSNAGRVNAASIPAIVASESNATIPIIQLNGGNEPQTDRGLLRPVSVVRADNLALYRSMYPEEDALERKMAVLDYLQESATRLQDEVGANDRLANLTAAESKVRGQFAENVGAKLDLTDEDRSLFTTNAPTGMGRGGADAFALALKLINNDICTCINLGIGGFDTHQGQTARLQPILTNVDFLIGQLVAGLRASNKLNDTLIVLYSDFGRTPIVNGSNGRDHWPTGGALIIGGGIDGGRAVGASDDNLNAVDLVNPTTGVATTDASVGVQLNPTHVGGMVVNLALGSGYSTYRPYLEALPALTRLKSS
jgi:uncharacterized protein (DUF1501 family)